MKKKGVCKAYPHPYLFFSVHMLLFLLWLVFLWRWYNGYGGHYKIVDIVLSILLPILLVLSLVYSLFFGWNVVVCFDEKKVFQRRGRKIFQLYWAEIVDVCFAERTLAFHTFTAYPYRIKLIAADGHKITFTLNINLEKKFAQICTNKEINEKFEQMMKLIYYC